MSTDINEPFYSDGLVKVKDNILSQWDHFKTIYLENQKLSNELTKKNEEIEKLKLEKNNQTIKDDLKKLKQRYKDLDEKYGKTCMNFDKIYEEHTNVKKRLRDTEGMLIRARCVNSSLETKNEELVKQTKDLQSIIDKNVAERSSLKMRFDTVVLQNKQLHDMLASSIEPQPKKPKIDEFSDKELETIQSLVMLNDELKSTKKRKRRTSPRLNN